VLNISIGVSKGSAVNAKTINCSFPADQVLFIRELSACYHFHQSQSFILIPRRSLCPLFAGLERIDQTLFFAGIVLGCCWRWGISVISARGELSERNGRLGSVGPTPLRHAALLMPVLVLIALQFGVLTAEISVGGHCTPCWCQAFLSRFGMDRVGSCSRGRNGRRAASDHVLGWI
jgi:hypothetical protein